ncbi:MAG: 4Fe-4S dicluster domain-containing protein [Aquificaceae bacterium]
MPFFLRKDKIDVLFGRLKEKYKIIAPKLVDGVISYAHVSTIDELPFGCRDHQAPGFYRVREEDAGELFTYTHPWNSPKGFLHPPELTLLKAKRKGSRLEILYTMPDERYALFDVRPCDLYALRILDNVFLKKASQPDIYYASLREGLFIVAVNCNYATGTCFCKYMGTGPEAKEGFDLCLTELRDGFFMEVGSSEGNKLLEGLELEPALEEHLREKEERIRSVSELMKVGIEREGLSEKLYRVMEDPYWEEVGERCLACTNCTQVCPTCFCFDIVEKNSFELGESQRVRIWDSCFNLSFATVHRFNIRESIKSRYRQWLMHKFAYWTDQYDTYGCVGCGRCITWCPAGIDIRREVKNLASRA